MPARIPRWSHCATLIPALFGLALFLFSCSPDPGNDGTPAPSTTVPTAKEKPSAVIRPFFHLPTANRALFDANAEDLYFTGTVGRTWTSGTFGCVRSEGYQFHEGLDIRSITRDKRGEALDPILAAADGTVAYVNRKAALSNYGIYVILRHVFQGWELFTLYAHMATVEDRISPGLKITAGETLGIMGRTANTRAAISKERAHLHFEINLLVNERFPEWHRKHFPGQRNDHGVWNGRNLLGIDPRAVFLEQLNNAAGFDLKSFIRSQPVLCRTLVRVTDFPWLRRYPATIEPGPATGGIVAFEIHHNFLGIPVRIIPRNAEEAPGRSRIQLLQVHAEVARDFPCQKLVTQRNGRWQFTPEGERFLDLLTF